MIGTHYDAKNFNCAHFVASWYRDNLNIEIPIIDEFELSFVRWMIRNFVKIDRPEQNCLVNMHNNDVSHIGVYDNYGVIHNYKIGNAKGSVVHWDLGVVMRNYKKVTFWQWSL